MATPRSKKKKTRKTKRKRARKGAKIIAALTAPGGSTQVHVKKREDGRGWLYYAEYRHPTRGRRRPSLQTDDLDEAKRRAAQIAEELALLDGTGPEEELARITQSRVELGTAFDAYREGRLPHFVNDGKPNGHWVNLDRVIRVAEAIWGRDQVVCEIGESHVDLFKATRAEGDFQVAARTLPDQHDRVILPADPVTLGPCGARTIRGELSLLSIILNWAARHPVPGGRGRKLLAGNPLDGIPFNAGTENPRQPVMSDRRYGIMLQYAPEVEAVTRGEVEYQRHVREEGVVLQRSTRGRRGRRFDEMPRGFLVTLLQLARGTGRRIESLLNLRVGDLLLGRERVRRKLLDLGWPEDWADAWPYGAIFWSPDHDKEGYSRLTPLSGRLHDQLRSYLQERGTIDPAAPLFPSPADADAPVSYAQAWRWFRRVEAIAREHDEDLPALRWGAWHPFRRQWRSERAGYFDPKLVALVGGWRRFENSHEAMQQGYLQYHPRALYLCSEFEPKRDAPSDGRIPGVNVRVRAPDRDGQAGTMVTQVGHTPSDPDTARAHNRKGSKHLQVRS